MSLLTLLAVSFAASPAVLPQAAAYGCVATGEASPSCAASAQRVAQGKGSVASPRARSVAAATGVAPACHPDPTKGRACRHHQVQAQTAQAGEALAAREDLR